MRYSTVLPIALLAFAFSAAAQVPVPDAPVPAQSSSPAASAGGTTGDQKPADPGKKLTTKDPSQDPREAPASTTAADAAAQAKADTTVVAPDATPAATPAYAGPSNLGRPSSLNPIATKSVRFRPYAGVNAIFASGLTGGSVGPDGQLTNSHSYGVEANFGISGTKVREKDDLTLDYHGSVFHYTPSGAYDGTNQNLALSYRRQLAKHLSIRFDETAGVYTNNFGVSSTASTTDLSVGNTVDVVSPLTQLVDDRTIYLSTSADVIFQKSARLSFDVGGSGFTIKRNIASLYGVLGKQGRGDAQYRLTKQSTVGVYYGYTNYSYSRAFGGSDINTLGVSWSYALSRRTEFRTRLGASHVQTAGLLSYNLDPVVSSLLGQRFGVVQVSHTNNLPDASFQVVQVFKHASAGAEVLVGVSPGNGLYLTSKRILYSGHVDYSGLRKYAFTLGVTREQLGSLGVSLGQYSAYGVNFNASRELQYGLRSNFRIEMRHYDLSSAGGFLRDPYKVSLGIAWSPGDRPLALW